MSFHKSEDRKKLKDKFKKGLKEVKKSVGKIVNKAADKLVPKEIAPFLPLAGMLVPGGMGITSYLLPQLFTALSTGKTRGDISLTGQALTGLGSFLKDPSRFTFGTETIPQTVKTPPVPGLQATGPQKDFFVNPDLFPDAGSITTMPAESLEFTRLVERPITDFSKLSDPSLLDAMKQDVNIFRDFIQGTGPVMEKAVVDGKIQQLPVLDAAGEPITKASLGMFDKANFPRLATQAALFGTGPLKDFYDTASDELDEAIRQEEEAERRRQQARARLGDYFFGLSDPRGRFRNFDVSGLLELAAGGRVGAQEGGPISGITDMINQSIDEMQDNLSQQIQGGFTTQETIVPIDAAPTNATTQPQGFQATPNIDLFRQRMNQMRSRLQQSGGQLGQSLFNPMSRQMMARQRQNQGQAGLSSLMNFAEGGMTSAPGVPPGMQVDGRDGTFIPMGVKEKADDVPARLSKNECVMTADAVKAAGGGSVNKGAQRMYDLMNTLEAMA